MTSSWMRSGRWSFGTAAACAVWSAWSSCLGACGKDTANATPANGSTTATMVVSQDASPLVIRRADALPHVDPLPPHVVPALTAREKVGRAIFFDAALSDPPGTSCASCHDPARGFSGNNGSKAGVARGSRPGHFARRNAPSVLYLKYVPAFHFALEDDDDVEPTPFGGLSWSGRADSVAEFVRLPLFDADEMNDRSEAEIAAKLRAASYADALAAQFPGALDSTPAAIKAFGEALQAFLTSDAMSPFTSKFDEYLRGKTVLTPLEMKGLRLFQNRQKGACQHCHPMYESWNRPEGSLFTTYAFEAVGVPRNRGIAANADPARYDLGLCERAEKKQDASGEPVDAQAGKSSDKKWCGSFRIPSLRNVAVRERFMHNGAFAKLRDVVAFYATRGSKPELWYPHGAAFDDLPEAYRRNVNTLAVPYNRREGDAPVLDDEEIDAIVAFLGTLTDAPLP